MPIGFIDRLKSNNPSGYGIVDAKEVAGHRSVTDLASLYELADPILSLSGNNTDNDAIGQLWYVSDEGKFYQLTDWANRKTSAGWTEFKTDVDLSGYATKSELANKADASTVSTLQTTVANKADASTVATLQTTVAGKADGSAVDALEASVGTLENTVDGLETSKADKTYVDEKVSALVDGAPETLDTLNEIAEALKDNADIVDVLNQSIANKADASTVTALQTTVASKADVSTVSTLDHTVTNLQSEVDGIDNTVYNLDLNKADKEDVEDIQNALAAVNDIAKPTITPNWSAYKNDGTTTVTLSDILVNNSSIKNPSVEVGYKLKYAATYMWTHTDGKRDPEAVSSDSIFSTLTESGVASTAITSTAAISSDKTLVVELTAPEVGYKTNTSGYLVPATGTVSVSDIAKVAFLKKMYYGTTNSATIDEAVIKALTGVK